MTPFSAMADERSLSQTERHSADIYSRQMGVDVPNPRNMRARSRAVDCRPLVLACALAVLALASLLAAPSAHGATLNISTEQLADRSSSVVVADVVSVTPLLDAVEGIITEVRLAPVRNLKGDSRSTLVLRIPGGKVGELELVVTETPRFSAGERVVVFLDGNRRVFGGSRGAMRISNDRVEATGETLARLEQRISDTPVSPSVMRAEPDVFSPDIAPLAESGTAPAQAQPAATPTIISVSPGSAPAGIGATIKISGSGFGVLGAQSAVQFRYQDPARISGAVPYVSATGSAIKSWTDSMIVVEVPVATVDGYPASAGSGPMRVVTATGAASNTYTFTVTFSYGGYRWADNDLVQPFYVWANTADTTIESSYIQAAASTWSAESPFKLTYAGAISSAPYDPSSPSYNSRNEIWWANMGDNGVLAQARYWFMSGYLWEADMTFNDAYNWGGGSAGTFDVQTVALHEFGHWLTMRDLYGEGDSDKVMFGICSEGTQKRTLRADDAAGVGWIYGGIDVLGPETTISGVPTGWTSGTVTITLSATDSEGVPTTYYRIGAQPIQTYTTPFTVPGEGAISVRYWSVDTAGNTEVAHTATVRIDRTSPTTSITGATSGYGSVPLSISAVDAHSGVAATYYQVDGGAIKTGPTVTVTGVGTHSVAAWSVDAAGNTEAPPALAEVTVQEVPSISISRLSGVNRYATAVAISKDTFDASTVNTVVLATGDQFADALSASGLAGAYESPLLLTARNSISAGALSEIDRLGASKVVLVGGTSAVGPEVETSLGTAGYTVERVSGSDRYATAAQVALRIKALEGSAPEVFIARGDAFADALAAAPYAYARKMPILLVSPESLPTATTSALREIGASSAIIAGGTGAISAGVESSIQARGISTTRAQGPNRYETSAALVRYAVDSAWITPAVIGVTTGQDFPDALGGGVAIGARGGAVILTEPSRLSSAASSVLWDCTDDLAAVSVFGGEGAVSGAVVASIKELWGLP